MRYLVLGNLIALILAVAGFYGFQAAFGWSMGYATLCTIGVYVFVLFLMALRHSSGMDLSPGEFVGFSLFGTVVFFFLPGIAVTTLLTENDEREGSSGWAMLFNALFLPALAFITCAWLGHLTSGLSVTIAVGVWVIQCVIGLVFPDRKLQERAVEGAK